MYFGGKLLIMIPKTNTINLNNVINYLNSLEFKKHYTFSNRFKIGHKQLSKGLIPKNIL